MSWAIKFPEASLATIVEALLALVAVVLALPIVPDDIEEAFKEVILAPLKVAVVDPVPPEATGSAVARVREVKCVIASTQSVPLLYTNNVLPAGTAMPV
jgi:hypothetical protein